MSNFRSENRLFLRHFFLLPLCFHFSFLFHKLNLLYFEIEFAQESKNFQEMDIIDVQKRDRRNPFGKFDAALGVLRNFFTTLIEIPCMQ